MVISVAFLETQDSMAWVKASMPVAAVSAAACCRSAGDRARATSGTRVGELIKSFS